MKTRREKTENLSLEKFYIKFFLRIYKCLNIFRIYRVQSLINDTRQNAYNSAYTCCVSNRFWYQLISLPIIFYLLKTAAVGLRMLLTEQITQKGAIVCGFCAGRTNVEITSFSNIPHGIRKVFQMK